MIEEFARVEPRGWIVKKGIRGRISHNTFDSVVKRETWPPCQFAGTNKRQRIKIFTRNGRHLFKINPFYARKLRYYIFHVCDEIELAAFTEKFPWKIISFVWYSCPFAKSEFVKLANVKACFYYWIELFLFKLNFHKIWNFFILNIIS